FTTSLDVAGLYTLRAEHPAGEEVLPAAISVAQALTINDIRTDNPRGENLVSDSGGTRVIVDGLGFDGSISVHWLEEGIVQVPAQGNIRNFSLTAEGLVFTSPRVNHQQRFQVAIRKPATDEVVLFNEVFTGDDDTRPAVVSSRALSRNNSLRLVFSEAVTASGFSVTAKRQDYSGEPDEIWTGRFELRVVENLVELRPLPGELLNSNRRYSVAITGLQDLRNNIALNANAAAGGISNGDFSSTLQTDDTLAPRDIELRRDSDNTPVTAAMTLTRGRTFTFVPSAIDNITAAGNLSFRVRKSTNGGLSFGPWIKVNPNVGNFSHAVQESDGNLAFRVQARDGEGNFFEQRFDATTVDPVIDISDVATDPERVEEMSRADILFDLSGDADLIKDVAMRVLGRWFPVEFELLDQNTGKVSLSFLNPRLSDTEPGDQIPVRLRVEFGFTGLKEKDDSYTLLLDATAPTISIASPGDGDRVAAG
ncbi:MAG: hypothetical protein MJA83_06140, partial [Gammaproteobacteria bacterium]|nr:hypothetical protein [Gammaproteobacteria bacterium]